MPDVLIAFMDSRNLCFFIANWMLRRGIIGKPSWNDGVQRVIEAFVTAAQ